MGRMGMNIDVQEWQDGLYGRADGLHTVARASDSISIDAQLIHDNRVYCCPRDHTMFNLSER